MRGLAGWTCDIHIANEIIVYSGVADLILAFFSWKIIWCLPVKRRDKVGLVAVMSLGVL